MKNIFNFIGWSYDDLPGYFPDKCVVIGVPHTTNMDTIRALTYMKIVKVHARLLIKSNWFFLISNCNTGIIMLKILLPEDQVEDPGVQDF